MDETFRSPISSNPSHEGPIEVWSGGACIRGYKKDGRWFSADGTAIMVEGWRPIKDDEPESLPDYADDWPKPKAKHKHKHKRK